jgi:hypothetical protein
MYEAVLAFNAIDAVTAVFEIDAVIANAAYDAVLAFNARDDVTAFAAIDAEVTLLAQLAVPNNEPVTLAFEPDTIMASALYCPILTVVSEKASIIGIPEMSFTANNDPDSWSVTENS